MDATTKENWRYTSNGGKIKMGLELTLTSGQEEQANGTSGCIKEDLEDLWQVGMRTSGKWLA